VQWSQVFKNRGKLYGIFVIESLEAMLVIGLVHPTLINNRKLYISLPCSLVTAITLSWRRRSKLREIAAPIGQQEYLSKTS
jgi:hypothetical protein